MACRVSQSSFTARYGVRQRAAIDRDLSRFGANLRRVRMDLQITQEKLAELVDLNVRTVQKIEAGETNILLTTVLRIQRALRCDWETLMPR